MGQWCSSRADQIREAGTAALPCAFAWTTAVVAGACTDQVQRPCCMQDPYLRPYNENLHTASVLPTTAAWQLLERVSLSQL